MHISVNGISSTMKNAYKSVDHTKRNIEKKYGLKLISIEMRIETILGNYRKVGIGLSDNIRMMKNTQCIKYLIMPLEEGKY